MSGVDSSELALLRESARSFLASEAPVARLRVIGERSGGVDPAFWTALAELGWLGVLVPQAAGGLGLGLPAMAALAEECGRALVAEPLIEVAGCAAPLLVALEGDALLGELIAGRSRPLLAWQGSPLTPFDGLAGLRCTQRAEGLVLAGTRRCVPFAAAASEFLVPVEAADGPALVRVQVGQPGLALTRRPLADGSHHADLVFDGCRLPQDAVVARGPAVAGAVAAAVDCGAVLSAAYLVGLMQAAFARTLEYLSLRHQFGRPIGSFQALQHRAVDLYLQQRLAAAVVQEAVRGFESGDADARAELASRARIRAGEAALLVTRQAIQIHGAIGFTDEHEIGLYLKRALVVASAFGTAAQHRQRLAAGLSTAHPQAAAPAAKAVEGPVEDWNALSDDVFRATVRAWFEREVPPALRHSPRRLRWAETREWYLKLADRGWLAPAWPREHGGMGLTPAKLMIFIEEQEAAGVPRTPDMGITMIGPLLIRHGSEAQRRRYLPAILRGEHIWCQGYSEPGAGSDLASLRTEARIDGDGFVINGQKTWTSLAQDATHMFLLARTDKEAKKQRGISFLLVDMKTPGITVRPIVNLAGHAEFCEVFLDEVRVPADALVGELNQGWTIAKALLGFERIFLGSPKQSQYALQRLREFALAEGLFGDAAFADRFLRLALDVRDLESLYAEFAAIVAGGGTLGPEVSILKIWATETYQRLTELFIEAAGSRGAELAARDGGDGPAPCDPLSLFYNARPATIYGGSNEIQRNIVAQNVLGLPPGP